MSGSNFMVKVHEVMRENRCDWRTACGILGERSQAKRLAKERAARPIKDESVARKARRWSEDQRKRLIREDEREAEIAEAAKEFAAKEKQGAETQPETEASK